MTREDVVNEARSWIGTPYHHLARVKGAGVDCAQLLLAVYKDVGAIPELEVGYYPFDWAHHHNEERYLGWVSRLGVPVTGTPQPGDVALFTFGRCVSHGAIVEEWPIVIHAYFRQGVVRTDVNGNELVDPKGRSRLHSVWSLKGL